MGVDLDAWIDKVKRCEYLTEDELKALCEYVGLPASCAAAQGPAGPACPLCGPPPDLLAGRPQIKEILVEESNVQPVNSPVTVRPGRTRPQGASGSGPPAQPSGGAGLRRHPRPVP